MPNAFRFRWRHTALLLIATVSIPLFGADRVQVAVLGLFHPTQLILEASPSSPLMMDTGHRQLMLGVDGTQRVTITRLGSTMFVQASGEELRSKTLTFSTRQGGDADFTLSVPAKLRRHYRGKLMIRANARELLPVVEMQLETAVASIVAAELPGSTSLEALKAQAVVTRSYLVASKRRHHNADFCDTTHCQFLREPPSPGSAAFVAAAATKDLVLAWQGKPFPAMYSASCGGRTHTLAEVGYAPVDYPYFSVVCPYCRRTPDRWSSRLDAKDALPLLPHDEKERTGATRKLGWNTVPSNTFTQTHSGGGVELNGTGHGHGVGLCQRGATAMAREGRGFRAILSYYFPNTTVEGRSVSEASRQ